MEKIKIALSYDLGADMHEAWRAPRKLENGKYEPRIKKSKDEIWNIKYGTDVADIANLSFEDLLSNWQYENLEAAKVVINLVFEKVMNKEIISKEDINYMASIIHKEWLKRNNWVFDVNYGDPNLAVSFEKLSKEEQDKDIAQIAPAIVKVMLYIDGKIDIDSICNQYGISIKTKVKK